MMKEVKFIILSLFTIVYCYDVNDPWSMYKDSTSVIIPKIKSVQLTNGGITYSDRNNREIDGYSKNKVVWPTNDDDYTDIEVHFEEEDGADSSVPKHPSTTTNKSLPSKISSPLPKKEKSKIDSTKNLEQQKQLSDTTTGEEEMVKQLISKTIEHQKQISITTTNAPPTQMEPIVEHCKLLKALLLESQNIRHLFQENKEIVTTKTPKILTTKKPLVINNTNKPKLVQDIIPPLQENSFQTVIPTEIISIPSITTKPTDIYRTFASNTIAKKVEKPKINVDEKKNSNFTAENLEKYKFVANEAINIPVKSLNLKHIIENVKENSYYQSDPYLDYHQKEGTNINIILKNSHDNNFNQDNNRDSYSNHRYSTLNSDINSNTRPARLSSESYLQQNSNFQQFFNPTISRMRKQFENNDLPWIPKPKKDNEETQTQIPALKFDEQYTSPSQFVIHEIQYTTAKPNKGNNDFTTEKPKQEPYFKFSTTKSISKMSIKPEKTFENPFTITTTQKPIEKNKIETDLFQKPLISKGEFRPSQPFNIVKYNFIDPSKYIESSISPYYGNFGQTSILSEDIVKPPSSIQEPKNIKLLPNIRFNQDDIFTNIYKEQQNYNIEKQTFIAHEFIDDHQDQMQYKNFNLEHQRFRRKNHGFGLENNYNFGYNNVNNNWQSATALNNEHGYIYGRDLVYEKKNNPGHFTSHGIKLESFADSWGSLKDKITKCKEKYQQLELKKLANKYYYIGTERMSWHTAQQFCYKHGLELASIETYEENELLTAALRKADANSYYWLGGQDETFQRKWRWSGTKKDIEFSAWGQLEPNNRNGDEHCIEIFPKKSGKFNWSDFSCSFELKFVCELEHDECDVDHIFKS